MAKMRNDTDALTNGLRKMMGTCSIRQADESGDAQLRETVPDIPRWEPPDFMAPRTALSVWVDSGYIWRSVSEITIDAVIALPCYRTVWHSRYRA